MPHLLALRFEVAGVVRIGFHAKGRLFTNLHAATSENSYTGVSMTRVGLRGARMMF